VSARIDQEVTMREIFTPSEWRLPHWLFASAVTVWFAIQTGFLQPREIALYFASRPEVLKAFSDPNFGRADALMLIFGTLFLGPFAVFIGIVLVVFVMAILGGAVLPVTRWMQLPDSVATGLVGGLMAGAAWTQSDVWVPRSLWFLSLLARAWRVVLA
jgi:hypothetical protein